MKRLFFAIMCCSLASMALGMEYNFHGDDNEEAIGGFSFDIVAVDGDQAEIKYSLKRLLENPSGRAEVDIKRRKIEGEYAQQQDPIEAMSKVPIIQYYSLDQNRLIQVTPGSYIHAYITSQFHNGEQIILSQKDIRDIERIFKSLLVDYQELEAVLLGKDSTKGPRWFANQTLGKIWYERYQNNTIQTFKQTLHYLKLNVLCLAIDTYGYSLYVR